GYGVAVDASNNVFVTGMFTNTVNFGGGPLTSAGSNDVFVVKYDGDGVHQWSTRLGGPSGDLGKGIGVDASGDVVVTGVYNGTFLVKYDTNGVQEWSQSFSGTDMVQGLNLAISSAGAIAVTGNLRGTTDFGGGPLTSAGDDDIFLVMSEATGAHRWSQRFGNTGDDWGHACAFDPSGNLIAGGIFSGSVDFGGGPMVSAGLSDVYLTKFDDHVADTTPPTISCPSDVQVEQAAPDGTLATHVTIAAFLAGASASDDEDPAPAITHDAPAVFPAGMTTVTFRATDSAGNYAECSAMVLVVDTTPPQITCPAAVEVDQATPEGTPATDPVIAAFLAGASASDLADPAPAITHDAPAVFPLGTTAVTFSAMDASGNHAECTAAVTVLDATAPQLDVVLDKDVLWPPDHNFVTVCAKVTVSDDGNSEPTFWLVSITSNEPVDKRGTGQTAPDIRGAEFGTPDLCFDLRAERAGDGSDRVYEIVYGASDGSGNEIFGKAWVRVPHDKSAELTSARPNPFNPQTTLEYSLSVGDRVQIAIYDARGSLVRRLVDQDMPAGAHRVTWNGLDQGGLPVGSGIYFVKLSAGSEVDTRKIVLLK
ncbi:MAG TPA: HYR domain-containing protein, partial [Candidatus Krumholzibacteria bacterium]|nr:HYR domain-containing protein [Candidatus Krumholzibacteria bacterium]